MPWPLKESGANRGIGERQRLLLEWIDATKSGQVMIDPKENNAAWCAAKRLTQRGLLRRLTFGGKRFGTVTMYELTERGKQKLREVRGSG